MSDSEEKPTTETRTSAVSYKDEKRVVSPPVVDDHETRGLHAASTKTASVDSAKPKAAAASVEDARPAVSLSSTDNPREKRVTSSPTKTKDKDEKRGASTPPSPLFAKDADEHETRGPPRRAAAPSRGAVLTQKEWTEQLVLTHQQKEKPQESTRSARPDAVPEEPHPVGQIAGPSVGAPAATGRVQVFGHLSANGEPQKSSVRTPLQAPRPGQLRWVPFDQKTAMSFERMLTFVPPSQREWYRRHRQRVRDEAMLNRQNPNFQTGRGTTNDPDVAERSFL